MKFDNHGELKLNEVNYNKDRKEAKKRVKVQDVTFRDGHQSIFATRFRTEDLVKVAEKMDKVGFHSMEVWGGATFDVMHRYLNEDPWQRIRTLKKHMPNTPFSMLLRGQNLVAYRNFADDVVEKFVAKACENGIDIFRVFDAVNDFRNFETAVKIIKEKGKHFQGSICYSLTEKRMGGDTYNLDYYVNKAKDLEKMGADSICIKDMAGLIAPYDAYNLIKALKKAVKVPIHLHTHFTSGMGDLTLLKAIEAGVDIIDACLAPLAYRTSHPAIEPLVVTLLGTNRDTGFDIAELSEISKQIEKEIIPKYKEYAKTNKFSVIDTDVIIHQTPGGMISNLVNQLRQMDELDKLDDVFEALPKVRKDLGQVPLVTPTSQIVGIQTVNNVLFDEKEEYTRITEQVKDLCFGLYGKTPKPINDDVRERALKNYPRGQEPITDRPGNILEPELPAVKEKVKDLAKSEEDELICALYPVTGERFLKWKYLEEEVPAEVKPKTMADVKKEEELVEKALKGELIPKESEKEKPENLREFDVFVDGEYFKVEVGADGMPAVAPTVSAPKAAPAKPKKKKKKKPTVEVSEGENPITAPVPGMVVKYVKEVGDEVKAGETVVILEAMKMENKLEAPCDGKLTKITSKTGENVSKNDVLCIIES